MCVSVCVCVPPLPPAPRPYPGGPLEALASAARATGSRRRPYVVLSDRPAPPAAFYIYASVDGEAMATLVGESIGDCVPVVPAVTADVAEPQCAGMGVLEGRPCAASLGCHGLVLAGLPGAGGDHRGVRAVVSQHDGCGRVVTRPLECAGEREQFSKVIGCSGDIFGTCRDLAAPAVYFVATLVFVAGTSCGYDKAVAGRF